MDLTDQVLWFYLIMETEPVSETLRDLKYLNWYEKENSEEYTSLQWHIFD